MRAAPPEVPPAFWTTPQFDDAFAAQHIGQVSRVYRKHRHHAAHYGRAGIPQEVLGRWLGMTQAQVSRIENGPPVRNLDSLSHWARTLRIPPGRLWFRLHGRSAADVPETQAPIVPSAGVTVPIHDDRHSHEAAAHAFRLADRQSGGSHLYPAVMRYLRSEIAPQLVDGDDDQGLFTTAAALTEMAGWMAHDAGEDLRARAHFSRALKLVQVGGDVHLGAHIFASLSHLANHLSEPQEAIRLAQQGHATVQRGVPQPELTARLLAMEARAYAMIGRSHECAKLLAKAESALAGPLTDEPSSWLSRFDEGALASEAARCMHRLGRPSAAQRHGERIIELRPAERIRSRAFGQLVLARAHLRQRQLEEAAAVALEALVATRSLSSHVVLTQLVGLGESMARHRSVKVVADLLDRFHEELPPRTWLFRRPGEEHSHPPDRREDP